MSEIEELEELAGYLAKWPDLDPVLIHRETVEKLIAAARESAKLAERVKELEGAPAEVEVAKLDEQVAWLESLNSEQATDIHELEEELRRERADRIEALAGLEEAEARVDALRAALVSLQGEMDSNCPACRPSREGKALINKVLEVVANSATSAQPSDKRDGRIERLRAGLTHIARSKHCAYDESNPHYASAASRDYALGVADGHRCAAREAEIAIEADDAEAQS